MATRVTRARPRPSSRGFGNGAGNRNGNGGGGGDGDGSGWRDARPLPPNTWRLGMALGLAGISMLFIALTSAYVVRQGMSSDWRGLRMPPVLLLNSAVLLASSLTMERARRSAGSGPYLKATLVLGVVFLAGQAVAWRELSAQGLYLGTNAHSSFFYLLTAVHGFHILGGVAALGWVDAFSKVHRLRAVDAIALYWHFMDGLWLYLLVLLFGWR